MDEACPGKIATPRLRFIYSTLTDDGLFFSHFSKLFCLKIKRPQNVKISIFHSLDIH